jgi:intein-encoded DNA endonuclease-like protein
MWSSNRILLSLPVDGPSRNRSKLRNHPRGRNIPLAVRIQLYTRAKELRATGLTYSEIAETLRRQYDAAPSKGQLSEWLRGIHLPFGSANRFVAEPTPELAYVIGVVLGDGSLNRQGYNRRIRLQSVDLDFVLEFDRRLSEVLGTRRHTPWFDTKRREIHIEASSVLLHGFLNQPWRRLKPWIYHCKACVSMFLRGFFDSEECVEVSGRISCSNTDLGLLKYIQQLLRRFFHIETRGPYRGTRKGTILTRRGKSYVRRADCYLIYVVMRDAAQFYDKIGLTIERKKGRLGAALGLL